MQLTPFQENLFMYITTMKKKMKLKIKKIWIKREIKRDQQLSKYLLLLKFNQILNPNKKKILKISPFGIICITLLNYSPMLGKILILRKTNQIYMLKKVIQEIKSDFNKEFEQMVVLR